VAALDFEIDIGAGSDRGYSVVVRSPGGAEATTELRLPAEVGQLAVRAPDAVLASSATVRRGVTSDEQPVRELGRLLYVALFAGDVRGLLLAARQRADLAGGHMRMIMRIGPPELARLPWEFMFDTTDGEYLCLRMPLIRHPQIPRIQRRLRVQGPLRVLGMIARSGDQGELATEDEKRRLCDALAPLEQAGIVELAWVSGQTWRALRDTITDHGPWHVLHFIGHGGFDASAGEGTLMLASDHGHSLPQPASNLALMLAAHDQLRLVVLIACDTGRASALDPFSSVAAALTGQRIPAVIGMQFTISDGAAVEFSRAFYEGIARRLPVDQAVTHARHAGCSPLRALWNGEPRSCTCAPPTVMSSILEAVLRSASGRTRVRAGTRVKTTNSVTAITTGSPPITHSAGTTRSRPFAPSLPVTPATGTRPPGSTGRGGTGSTRASTRPEWPLPTPEHGTTRSSTLRRCRPLTPATATRTDAWPTPAGAETPLRCWLKLADSMPPANGPLCWRPASNSPPSTQTKRAPRSLSNRPELRWPERSGSVTQMRC